MPPRSPKNRLPQSEPRATRVLRFLRTNIVLLLLLVADVATKVAAFHLLPQGEAVPVAGGLQLFLAVNEWGVMGGVHGITAVTENSAYTMVLAFGLLVFSVVVSLLGSSSLRFGWRVLAGVGFFLTMALVAEIVARLLAGLHFPVDVVVATIRFAVLVLSLAFYSASQAWWPRTVFTLLAAGALSNAASYAYPPFDVVDFLVVPLQPLVDYVSSGGLSGGGFPSGGSASNGDGLAGVINLADVYLFSVPLVLLVWPFSFLLRRLRRER